MPACLFDVMLFGVRGVDVIIISTTTLNSPPKLGGRRHTAVWCAATYIHASKGNINNTGYTGKYYSRLIPPSAFQRPNEKRRVAQTATSRAKVPKAQHTLKNQKTTPGVVFIVDLRGGRGEGIHGWGEVLGRVGYDRAFLCCVVLCWVG